MGKPAPSSFIGLQWLSVTAVLGRPRVSFPGLLQTGIAQSLGEALDPGTGVLGRLAVSQILFPKALVACSGCRCAEVGVPACWQVLCPQSMAFHGPSPSLRSFLFSSGQILPRVLGCHFCEAPHECWEGGGSAVIAPAWTRAQSLLPIKLPTWISSLASLLFLDYGTALGGKCF